MLKWIKNSKGAVTNKSSNYRGITQMKSGRYKATVLVRNKGTKAYAAYVGTYDSIKEAKKKRVEFILSLL